MRSLAATIAVSFLLGCDDYRRCDQPPVDRQALAPDRLSRTGLDLPGVRDYTPRFQLWADGAEKRRRVWLPPGMPIDTSSLDAWQFPPGTRFWKEFTRDGVKVETRLIQKTGPEPGEWLAIAYLWLPDGSDAVAAPDGQVDASGTPHDVPAAAACWGCHGGTRAFALGFSAVQLSPSELEALAREGRLSHPPAQPPITPGSARDAEALGYLHANCGHCHNLDRPPRGEGRCFDPQRPFDLHLAAEARTLEETGVWRTVLDTGLIERGSARRSGLVHLLEAGQMPPLAREQVDAEGLAALRSWIDQL